MKRFLVLLSFCLTLSVISLYADDVVKYNEGFLGTKAEFKFTVETRNDSVFLIVNVISQEAQIRDDAKMLVKFSDKSVAKLIGTRKEHGLINAVSGSVGGYGGTTYGSTSSTLFYYSVAEFYVPKEEMDKFEDGIIKIRLNTSPVIYNKEWSKDKIGKPLYEQYIEMKDNSFEDNF